MNETELRQAVAKASRAEQLLNDPMIVSTLAKMREVTYHNIATSHHKDVDEREKLYLMLKTIESFEKQFRSLMQDGKMAESKLKELFNQVKQKVNWR
jgi:tRNA C32,U32 (ribose-2'-O)-methylase TrmJ